MRIYQCLGCGREDRIPDNYPAIETVMTHAGRGNITPARWRVRWAPRRHVETDVEHWHEDALCGQMVEQ